MAPVTPVTRYSFHCRIPFPWPWAGPYGKSDGMSLPRLGDKKTMTSVLLSFAHSYSLWGRLLLCRELPSGETHVPKNWGEPLGGGAKSPQLLLEFRHTETELLSIHVKPLTFGVVCYPAIGTSYNEFFARAKWGKLLSWTKPQQLSPLAREGQVNGIQLVSTSSQWALIAQAFHLLKGFPTR